MNMNELINDFVKEAIEDYVSLWEIAQSVREDLRPDTEYDVRRLTMEIVQNLYDKGLRPGDYYLGSRFDYWPDNGRMAVLDRIGREWVAAGTDPSLAEPICYFARPTD